MLVYGREHVNFMYHWKKILRFSLFLCPREKKQCGSTAECQGSAVLAENKKQPIGREREFL